MTQAHSGFYYTMLLHLQIHKTWFPLYDFHSLTCIEPFLKLHCDSLTLDIIVNKTKFKYKCSHLQAL